MYTGDKPTGSSRGHYELTCFSLRKISFFISGVDFRDVGGSADACRALELMRFTLIDNLRPRPDK